MEEPLTETEASIFGVEEGTTEGESRQTFQTDCVNEKCCTGKLQH
jgi:hypothetical protein